MGEDNQLLHVIVNPAAKSGKGENIWAGIEELLRKEKIPFRKHDTTQTGDARLFIGKLAALETELSILVLGGDGTLNEVIQGIQDFDHVKLYYVPIGSSNDFARDFELKGSPIERMRRILEQPQEYHMDLGEAQMLLEDGSTISRLFSVSTGIGFDAAVCEEVNKSSLKTILNKVGMGKLVYLGIALKQLARAKMKPCKLYLDDQPPILMKKLLFVTSMIHCYEGGGFKFCPEADASDGRLDLCAVDGISKLKILCVLPTAFSGKHVRYREIHIFRAERIHIQTDQPLFVHFDGEVPGVTRDVTITCLKQKMKLYM